MTPDQDPELGERLRRELAAEAESIVPAAGGLERIRSRIAIRRGRFRLPGWWSSAADLLRSPDGRLLRPAMAAAGAAIIVIAALASVPGVRERFSQSAAPGVASSTSPPGAPGGVAAGTGGQSPGGSSRPETRTTLPRTGTQGGAAPAAPPSSCSPKPQPTSGSPAPAPSSGTSSANQQSPAATGHSPGTTLSAPCPVGSAPPAAHGPASGPPATQGPAPTQGSTGLGGTGHGGTGGATAGQSPVHGTSSQRSASQSATATQTGRLILLHARATR
jgi:hypothetical protein